MNSPPLSLNDLRITLNGTFVRTPNRVSDDTITQILTAARSNEDDTTTPLLVVRRAALGTAKISAVVYYSNRDAYFAPSAGLFDIIASYIIVIEIADNEIAIFKKSCGPLTPLLETSFEVASYEDLINTFDDSRSLIQKINTREMVVSEKGIKSRSYEAVDLKGHMSPHAAGRSIPRFTQIRLKNHVRSISLNTGRVNQLSDRVSVSVAAEWASEIFQLMKKPRVNKSFFSTFARKVSLTEVLANARPASILFERSAIEEHLAEEKIDLWYSHFGKYRKLHSRSLKRILNTMDQAFEVDESLHIAGTRNSTLKVNKKTVSPHTVALKRLKIKNGKEYITFQSWITDNGYFIVSFSRPDYIYLRKSCFQDRAGRSEIDSILKCLQPVLSFNAATSEKGYPTPGATSFDRNSLFHKVERHHSPDNYILCDDLGNEWADHITINLNTACVTFIHSKHAKKSSNSASALHEVVGQAIKNLGSMHFNFSSFSYKTNSKFKKTYGKTAISRTRKGNPANLNADIKSLLSDHRLHRKCVVACSSLSKSAVKREFDKMKRGDDVPGHVTQLFWILSSFIHSAQGSSSVPIVYCKP